MGSFSTEPDFEHGEWIDGEFYATAQRDGGKRKRTKEDNLYGIFGEGGDSSDEEREERRFGKKGSALRAAPAFVKTTVQTNSEPETREPVSGPAPKQGLGNSDFSSMIGRAAEKAQMGQPQPAVPKASSMSAEKVDKDFGSFEQHTKGFGAKMLEKMGWTKGQGIGKQGILNPIESKLRPSNLGMGYGGFKETTTKAKQQQKRILHGSDTLDQLDSDEEEQQKAAAAGGGGIGNKLQPRPQYWKKAERRELKIKGAKELKEEWKQQEEAEQGRQGASTVLDMRGPQVRLHSSMQGVLAEEKAAPPPPEPTICPELQHNMRIIVDTSAVELGKKQRKLRLEREALQQLLERRDRQGAVVRTTQARLQRLEAVRDAVNECTAAAKAAAKRSAAAAAAAAASYADADEGGGEGGGDEPDAALSELARKWALLRQAYPEEYVQWKLHDLGASLVLAPFKRLFARWRPMQRPRYGAALAGAWQAALCPRHAGAPPPPGGEAAYGALVYATVLPPLRSALANEWEVVDSDTATAVLEAWRGALPEVLYREMIETQVLPRLAAQLTRYRPKADPPPHTWLHPWLPLLPAPGLAPLFPQLRHKLAGAIGEADAAGADPAARAVVAPWQRVFDAGSWAALLNRHVLPKLAHVLSLLVVNPAAQELGPLEAVLAWAPLLSADQLYTLLAHGFFPPWLATLRAWLRQQPDFQEVSQWYLGWKSLLQERAPRLLQHDGAREQLNAALAELNDALTNDAPPLPPDDGDEPPPPPPPPPDEVEDAAPPQAPAAPGTHGASRWQAPEDEMSLRETLERLAASRDLVFMPTGARHDGKQVFRFGGVPLFFDPDKRLIFAKLDEHGFKPVSIQRLLEKAA